MQNGTNIVKVQKIKGPIVEKKLKIAPDYQFRAISQGNFFQKNWHKNKMLATKTLVNLDKKTTVLDLGTGSGNFELFFAREFKKIVGVDYNDEALYFLDKTLRKRDITNVDLILADIRKLNSLDIGKFDLIVAIDVLEHLKLPQVKSLIKSLKKFLNKGGKVLIITPNYKSSWVLVEYLFDLLRLAPKFREEQHLSRLYRKNLEEIIEGYGFKIEKICSFNFPSFLLPVRSLSEKLCLMEMSVPFPFSHLIAVVFSKKS
ncbi:MAG: hypothetical protein UX19_C0003G0021 [Candidatus Woesebacteria bacterium GW2011_GWA1_45_8]|uniref:Uncharacterized protein n=1 Tax=Candidatus Woesebacteria bacterium GW2011_GWA1_45_8 TaxID=1618559 RepID=A0A0G1MVC3_9BACT|nr:MAG: hypothetical protein UX19_C0003G0021 [Candidatus Woesebacteria bacterium GW2011_GWA1_45_8]